MKDWSGGNYRDLAIVHTKQGYRVAQVKKRLAWNAVEVERYSEMLPVPHLETALDYLKDIRQSQLRGLL